MRRLGGAGLVAGLGAGAALVAVGSLALASDPAGAVAIDNGAPGALWLDSEPLPEWTTAMEPGDRVSWPIATMLETAEAGSLELQLEVEGGLAAHPSGLWWRLEECPVPWSATDECPVVADTLAEGPLAHSASDAHWNLGALPAGSGRYFLVTLWLPETVPAVLQGESAALALGFTAAGDSASVITPPGLPNTGRGILAPLSIAAGILVAGLVLAHRRVGESR